MNHRKETTLIKIKAGAAGMSCVCFHILELKNNRLLAEYEYTKERIARAKTRGQNYERLLRHVMKTGNKARALKEAISEIAQAHEILDKMIHVEINGKDRPRLNANSDYQRSCAGKVAYSQQSAEQAVIDIGDKYGDVLEHYKCRHCDGWHVGHAPHW